MRKQFLYLSTAACLLLLAFGVEKTYTIKLPEPKMVYHWQNIEGIKQLADQSQLPHNQVKFIINALDSLQKDIQNNLKIDSVKTK